MKTKTLEISTSS